MTSLRNRFVQKLLVLGALLGSAAAIQAAGPGGSGPVRCSEMCLMSYRYCGVWTAPPPGGCGAALNRCLSSCTYYN